MTNFANKYATRLAAYLENDATSCTVESVTGDPAVPYNAIIGRKGAFPDEIVTVTNVTGTTLTITRATEAVAGVQTATDHPVGATFTAILTAAALLSATEPLLWVGPFDPRLLPSPQATVANQGVVMAFTVSRSVTVDRVRTYIGTSSGNLDFGIYQGEPGATLTLLTSTGSVASPGTGNRTFTFTAVTLEAGTIYWAGYAADNATVTIPRVSGSGWGPTVPLVRAASTSFPLPASYAGTGIGGNVFGFWFEKA